MELPSLFVNRVWAVTDSQDIADGLVITEEGQEYEVDILDPTEVHFGPAAPSAGNGNLR